MKDLFKGTLASMVGLIGAFAFFTLLNGCVQTQHSETLSEDAVVVQTVYTPGQHGHSDGFDTNGDYQYSEIHVEPTYATVFQCEHGKFIVERKDVWEKVTEGDSVTVLYQEVYRMIDDKRAELLDYDFLDVYKKKLEFTFE